MYVDHPSVPKPADFSARIWRYLDLAKFVSLISRRAQYFPQLAKLDDPFEGSLTTPFARWQAAFMAQIRQDHPNAPIYSEEKMIGWRKTRRHYSYVNCWHLNEDESAAMWVMYGRVAHAVAIRSTIRRLVDATRSLQEPFYLGQVTYANYEEDSPPAGDFFSPLFMKRRSFEHEREIRALVSDFTAVKNFDQTGEFVANSIRGRHIPTVLESLIERIYVAPQAPDWFYEIVRDLADKWDLSEITVEHSTLDAKPLY
jgi:hypothetical protein